MSVARESDFNLFNETLIIMTDRQTNRQADTHTYSLISPISKYNKARETHVTIKGATLQQL